jgi:uncharacterized Zn-binding protein involved in type VI secretion
MPPAARVTDMHICPMVTGIVPHVGGPILPPCSPNVLIGYLPAARITDLATCVGPPDTILMGSPTVLINNLMAARIGDPTVHGGVIVLGCFTVIIGEAGGPASSAPVVPPTPATPLVATPGPSDPNAAAKEEIENDLADLRKDQASGTPNWAKREAVKNKLLNLVEKLDVSSPKDKAVFYSGPGMRDAASAAASGKGLSTIESLPDGKWLDSLQLFDKEALGPDSAYQVWDRMSERYAGAASGEVHCFVNNPSPRSTFLRKELPALQKNPNVKLPKEWAGT